MFMSSSLCLPSSRQLVFVYLSLPLPYRRYLSQLLPVPVPFANLTFDEAAGGMYGNAQGLAQAFQVIVVFVAAPCAT